MAYGKRGLVKGQNKDDQQEYSKAVQEVRMNSEQRPGDMKVPKMNMQSSKSLRGARKYLGIKKKK